MALKFLDLNGLAYLWEQILEIIPSAEDNYDVLNMMTDLGYNSPLSDKDGYVFVTEDGEIYLG